MNAIEKIPFYQRRKNVPPQLKMLALMPFNGSFGKLTQPIVGKDSLRPAMMGNFFDLKNSSIVGTDAHKLYHLPMDEVSKNYDGVYLTIQDLEKEYKKIWFEDKPPFEEWIKKYGIKDEKYPQWDAIVPYDSPTKVYDVDVQKLWWYSTVLSKGLYLPNDPNSYKEEGYNSYKLRYAEYDKFLGDDKKMICVLKDYEGNYRRAGFNADFVSKITKFLLQLGHYKCTIHYASNSKAVIFHFGDTKTYFDKYKSSYILLMPLMLDYSDFVRDITIDYTDSTMNENIAYNLSTNQIISNGEAYVINESLGFKPSKGSSIPKATPKKKEVKTENVIDKKLKVLNLMLTSANSSNKELIEKKIKLLNLMNK